MKHKPGVWYPAEDIPDPDEQYTKMANIMSLEIITRILLCMDGI